MNDLVCPDCGREGRTGVTYPLHCLCGGLWWAREPQLYPVPPLREEEVESSTPLWQDPKDTGLLWKREDLNRSGSFKDRGAVVLAALAHQCGAHRLVVDSSGSAALAAAAAAAEMELELTVHTPGDLPSEKLDALTAFGAQVVAQGDRGAAARRAGLSAQSEFYVSHVYHPAFREGTAQAALEVFRQTGGDPPSTWLVPVGNGSLLLGLGLALLRSGVETVRLVAVQAAACPGLREPGGEGRTGAAGIGIATPPRREEILAVLERFQGTILEIEEEDIVAGRDRLGRRGVAAELAVGAVVAAVERLRGDGESGSILGWVTGAGHRGG